jgi:hypothetical protein
LANLPITIVECSVDRCIYLRARKWCEGEYSSPPHSRLVRARSQNGRNAAFVSDRTESGCASFTNERVIVFGGEGDDAVKNVIGDVNTLAIGPHCHLDNDWLIVV